MVVQAPKKVEVKEEEEDDDDDMDLFGSDDEDADAEAERLKEERIAAYSAKKSKKPVLIAKSSILLDVKPVCGSIIFPSLAKPLQQLFHLCVLACIIYCVVFVIG